jgi:hypothetical protein
MNNHEVESENGRAEINPVEIERDELTPEQVVVALEKFLENGAKLFADFKLANNSLAEMAGENSIARSRAGNLEERAGKLWEVTRSKLLRVCAIGLAVLAFSGAGEFGVSSARAAEANSISSGADFEAGGKKEKSAYETKMDQLRQAVLNEESERYVIFAGNVQNSKLVFEGVGKETSFQMNLNEVQIGKDISEVEIIHTHPLAFKKKPRGNKNAGNKGENVMPPSFQDIVMAVVSDQYFFKKNIKVKNSVVDPEGKWEFSVDRNNGFIKALTDFNISGFELAFDILTEDDLAVIKKEKGDLFLKADPRNYLFFLLNDPSTKAIGEKLQNQLLKIGQEKMANYQDEDGDNLISIPTEITEDNGLLTSEKRKRLISKFIESARKKGVSIKYTPFDEVSRK